MLFFSISCQISKPMFVAGMLEKEKAKPLQPLISLGF